MCLLLIAHSVSPRYPLVLAANRDEFFARPTRQAGLWPKEGIIAGRDLRAGGTWLAIGLNGRFAAVTNVRESGGNGAGSRSRGELPLDFLRGRMSPAQYLAENADRFDQYAGFNLLLGDLDSVCCGGNRSAGVFEAAGEIFGVANGAPGSDWPKVLRGKEKIAALLGGDADLDCDLLIDQMRDATTAAEAELPVTGISRERESRLSSIFIPTLPGGYGTRCSSVLIREEDGECHFSEWNFNAAGEIAERHYFNFSLARRVS